MYTLKKSLGQHFLTDESICLDIVSELKKNEFSQLLEVGPGGGALTKYLVGIKNIDFKACELDDEKVSYLVDKFPILKDKIIHQSILEIDKPFEGNFTIIGNFPYNISTQILFKVLDWKEDVECMIGMFQKEVALRIAAKEGSKTYGVTSVLTQAFFHVELLMEVNETSFKPPPKVKSAVIRLLPKEKHIDMKSERALFNLVKTAFQQRRKTLRNAVKSLFDAETLKDELFNKRAEQLSVEQFGALTFRMM